MIAKEERAERYSHAVFVMFFLLLWKVKIHASNSGPITYFVWDMWAMFNCFLTPCTDVIIVSLEQVFH